MAHRTLRGRRTTATASGIRTWGIGNETLEQIGHGASPVTPQCGGLVNAHAMAEKRDAYSRWRRS